MRILVIGASGLVGSAMMRAIPRAFPSAVMIGTYKSRPGAGLKPLNAMDPDAVLRLVADAAPDHVLFPAGAPDVEWCEAHDAEARDANLVPLRHVLRARVPTVTISSDYVFDGASGPYAEDAKRAPLSVYGRIKAQLEDETLSFGGTFIRTTGVFGAESPPAMNFALRLVASLRRGEPVKVPSDQIATPTYADDLATAAYRIATSRERGGWHVGGRDLLSRVDLARRVAAVWELDASLIRPVTTAELAQRAARPLAGGLRNTRFVKTFGAEPVRPLDDALRELRSLTR